MSTRDDTPHTPPSHSSTQRSPAASPNSDAAPAAPLTPASRDSRSESSSNNARQFAYALGTPQQQPATAVLASPISDLQLHERTRSLSANSSLAHAAAAKHPSDSAAFDSTPHHSAAPHSTSASAPGTPPRVPAMVLPSTRSHAAASSQVASAAAEPAAPVVMRTPLALNLNAARMHRAATVASPRSSSGAVIAVAPSPSSAASSASGPPPFLRMNSVSLTPVVGSSSTISWVCQSNRELVRTFFAKKQHTHRGILDSHFLGMQQESMGAASHVRRPSSATAPSLQHQLLHAPLSRFHIAVVGSAGCGKTSTIHNVSGRAVPPKHQETSGMQLMDCTWPYKTAEGAVWLLDYLFWDSGFTAAAQYKYVASTPESHAHLVLYFVSCVEKGSWSLAQKRMEEDAAKPFAKLLVLTKIDDRTLKREVQESDILAFQDSFNKQHYPAAIASASSSASSSASAPRSYTRGSLVVCKIANWPISTEPFYTRPGVTSLLNTIAAMCLAQAPPTPPSK